jgi:hypothetical protein
MKYILTTLALTFFTCIQAQTTVSAKTYFKSSLVSDRTDTSIVIRKGGYADYSVYIPKSGVYSFSCNILNDLGAPTTVNFKLPLGQAYLATVAVPLNPNYTPAIAKVKMSTANKSIRMVFDDDVTMSSFSYSIDGITPTPTPSGTVSQADFDKLKARFDSLKNVVDTSWYELDPTIFQKRNGRVTIPSLLTPTRALDANSLLIQKIKSNADGSITIKKVK